MNDSQNTGSPLPWGRWGEVCLVALLGVVMALRAVDTYSELSATYDEGYHIAEGLRVHQEGNFAIGAEQAPLAHWAIGWLPHRAGVEYRTVTHRSASGHVIRKLSHAVLEEQGDYWTTLTSARLATLLFLPILVFYSYHWARRLYGRAAGWAACVLVTFSPSLLGHAALATIDLAAAALMVAAVYHLADWLERPTRRGAVLAGLFSGAAMATKYSSVVFVPVVAAAFVLIAWRGVVQRRVVQRGVVERGAPAVQIRTRAAQSLLLMAAAVLTIWTSFGLEARPLRDPSRRPYEALDRLIPAGSALSSPAHWVAENVPVPLQDFAAGIEWVTEVDELDHPGFLFGQVRREGWWYYFPAVFAVKTTWPFLVLVVLGVIQLTRSKSPSAAELYPLVGGVTIVVSLMTSPLDLGVRHMLAVYPCLAVSASSWFREGGKRRSRSALALVLGLLLLGWHAVESVAARPDYLAYFNSFVRGREHQVLGDSNLDWGQDLHRLARYAESHGIDKLHLDYFGASSPGAAGLGHAELFGPQDRPRGWVAISVTHLQGIYQPAPAWLEGREPRAKIGKSIWLYYVD